MCTRITSIDVSVNLWVHRHGITTREFCDRPLAVQLPSFGLACDCDFQEVTIRFPAHQRDEHESPTWLSPGWSSSDAELDRRSSTMVECDGVASCLLPAVAAELFDELMPQ